jgi:hypothetical protein
MTKMPLLLSAMLLASCASANFDIAPDPNDVGGDETLLGGGRDTAVGSDSGSAEEGGDDGVPDTSPLVIDAGAVDSKPVDTGVLPPADTGVLPPADTGALPVDTGTPPIDTGSSCSAITMGCLTSSSDGTSCERATNVGRVVASSSSGYIAAGVVTSTSFTDGESGCAALGPDRAYKIFVHKGEHVDTVFTSKTAGVVLQTTFWESGSCDGNVCSGGIGYSCGVTVASGPSYNTYIAKGDGWVSILVSARAAVPSVTFDAQIALSVCKTAGCGC